MGTPHRNHDVIVAWAKGEDIQHRHVGGNGSEWITYSPIGKEYVPGFGSNIYEWRVKPPKKWYRMALLRSGALVAAQTIDQELQYPEGPNFVRWLTERIEYEI